MSIDPKKELGELIKCMSDCMKNAIDEDPKSETWTSDQVWEKGAEWAARNIIITEKKDV